MEIILLLGGGAVIVGLVFAFLMTAFAVTRKPKDDAQYEPIAQAVGYNGLAMAARVLVYRTHLTLQNPNVVLIPFECIRRFRWEVFRWWFGMGHLTLIYRLQGDTHDRLFWLASPGVSKVGPIIDKAISDCK